MIHKLLLTVLLALSPVHVAPAGHAVCANPVVYYWVYDTANPSRGWFLVNSGDLTSGLFVGWGGTWVLGQEVSWCP